MTYPLELLHKTSADAWERNLFIALNRSNFYDAMLTIRSTLQIVMVKTFRSRFAHHKEFEEMELQEFCAE